MAHYLTTNSLIENVVTRGMIPETQNTFTEERFLMFANDAMELGVVPHILSYHENYLLKHDVIQMLPGVTRYEIPSRAIGNKLRDVSYVDTSGGIIEMTQIDIDDESFYPMYTTLNLNIFYIEGNEIVTTQKDNGSLKVSYYLRPSQLVSETRSARITAINTSTNTLTLDLSNSSDFSITLTDKYDITSTKNPFKAIGLELVPSSFTTTSVTFSQIPSNLQVGDVLTYADESIIPQIPVELHNMLAQRMVMSCYEALGDVNGLQAAGARLAEMELKTGSLLDNRVEGAPRKITTRHSALRRTLTAVRRR